MERKKRGRRGWEEGGKEGWEGYTQGGWWDDREGDGGIGGRCKVEAV